jgi:ubiquitin C-terminal hydrolase
MLQKEMGDWLNIYEQNDINEFIMFFIDKINAEIKTNMPIPPALSTDGSINKKKVSFVEKINQSWYQSNKAEYSELKDMFYGQSVTQIVCGGCNKIHHNYEIMMNMMLPIVADKDGAYTLQGCLEHHYADEKLNGNEGHDNSVWKCDHCDKKAESVKTIRAWRNPKVFVISIKRFNERLQKISTLVDIPLELDMSDYTIQINNGTPTKYELRSVGYHFGSFGGGHYVSMCKNYDDTWCIKDDDRIIQIKDTKQVLSDIKKGYMFFYEAIDI